MGHTSERKQVNHLIFTRILIIIESSLIDSDTVNEAVLARTILRVC